MNRRKRRRDKEGPITHAMIEEYMQRYHQVEAALSESAHPWHRRYFFLCSNLKRLTAPGAGQRLGFDCRRRQHTTSRTFTLLESLRHRVEQILFPVETTPR